MLSANTQKSVLPTKVFKKYGFHNSDEMIIRALEFLKQELELTKELKTSTDLYTKLYDPDEETKGWSESSVKDWD